MNPAAEYPVLLGANGEGHVILRGSADQNVPPMHVTMLKLVGLDTSTRKNIAYLTLLLHASLDKNVFISIPSGAFYFIQAYIHTHTHTHIYIHIHTVHTYVCMYVCNV